MFKSDFRGCLKANGKQINPKQLSKLCSENEDVIILLLNELKEYEVYSTLEDGTIYSRRMYRQTKNEREISKKRSEAGKLGGRPSKSKV